MSGAQSLSVPSEVSEAKAQANRLNSRKSTGPRTAEGKAKSSTNRLSHGFFSRRVVLEGEDEQEFELLRSELIAEHQPASITQRFLVERLAISMWRLNRMRSIEEQAHHWERESVKRACSQRIYEEHRDVASTSLRILHGATGPSVLEKLELYERRLEASVHRCLRQLRQMKEQQEETENDGTKPRPEETIEPEEAEVLQDEGIKGVECIEDGGVTGTEERESILASELPPHSCHLPQEGEGARAGGV